MRAIRHRSNSGVRLDYYQRLVYRTILDHQDAVTGLIPTSGNHQDDHAWVRDNVYSILAVWALAMAYKKNADLDEDRAKTYELEQSCVKLMRGLLMSMMRQKEKVERFKQTQNPLDSLHAKYSSQTGACVVSDTEWGHLQLDATSLYLLILAQMTASGLQIVFNLDEVAFIQNLVFYIETTYCVPDYGIWERGDKTNHGLPELNSSSIGMAKAALEALDDLDLFGSRGGPFSVIHVLADEAQKCHAVLQSMLPRESNSKELDAALLTVIGYPAFAVDDGELIEMTNNEIIERLLGRYGCKRFLRDGYKTPKEDPNRLYYESWELSLFENIECEWPLFLCYLVINSCFTNDRRKAEEYSDALDKLLILTDNGLKLVPEMYMVPPDKVEAEKREPHTQTRVPIGKRPFMWAQSLYIIGRLLMEGFVTPGELDPLNRRLSCQRKPDVVVQVVLLAETEMVREHLAKGGVSVETVASVPGFEILPARVLGRIYTYLGRSAKLGLTGRQTRNVGIKSTSKMYKFRHAMLVFTPQFADQHRFYIASDMDLLMDTFKTEIAYLKANWRMLGRPTVVLPLSHNILIEEANGDVHIHSEVMATIRKLKSGYTTGTRLVLGTLDGFISTSSVTSLNFCANHEEAMPDTIQPSLYSFLNKEMTRIKGMVKEHSVFSLSQHRHFGHQTPSVESSPCKQRAARDRIHGIIQRSRSVHVEAFDLPESCFDAAAESSSFEEELAAEGDSCSLLVDSDADDDLTSTVASGHVTSPSHVTSGAGHLSAGGGDDVISGKDRPFQNVSEDELVVMLGDGDSTLDEQGDILHCLVMKKGLNWDTGLGEDGNTISVRHLLNDLYEKAYKARRWGLVRHVAGLLGKRVEDLAKAVTDLLVRRKHITVGQGARHEVTITRPQPAQHLRALVHRVYQRDDKSTVMLTQELIVYLAMFVRTEPELFSEMLRLRIGLIIQVMIQEMSRLLLCTMEEASEHLLNMCPFEIKKLLHYILIGKEFIAKFDSTGSVVLHENRFSKRFGKNQLSMDAVDDRSRSDKQGQWIRRRRLDGALNKVPVGFYTRLWTLLEKNICVSIEGKLLSHQLTREMTQGELKFALEVERVLISISEPEYRQLVVEALAVLALLTEHGLLARYGNTGHHRVVSVDNIVANAYQIFLQEQRESEGDATLCCAANETCLVRCKPVAGICQHFYDSAPSGRFGTMTYMVRAVTFLLEDLFPQELDCITS